MGFLDDLKRRNKGLTLAEVYAELPRLGTRLGGGARRVGELPSKLLFGESGLQDIKELQGPERLAAERAEEAIPPAETRLQQAIDVVGPAVAPTLAALPAGGPVAKIGGRGARLVFDAIVDSALGYSVAPEGKGLQTAGVSAVLGPALGQIGRFKNIGPATGQLTQLGGKKALEAGKAVVPDIKPPKPTDLVDIVTRSYKDRAFKGPTRKADEGLRSLWEQGGEALPGAKGSPENAVQRALQDNMIRSLPAETRLQIGRQWANVFEATKGKKAVDIPPVHREGIRQFALQQTAMAKKFALETDVQRHEILRTLLDAVEETSELTPLTTKQLADTQHILTRLPGDIVGKARESLGGMDPASRARFSTLLDGVRCLSPCVPVVEILQRPGTGSLIREIRMAGMLSGLGTWARNTFGTSTRASINPVRTVVAGGLDLGKAKSLGLPRERYAEEVLGEMYGFWQGLKAAIGRKSFQSNMPQDLVDYGLRTRAIREFGSKPPSAIGAALSGKLGQAGGKDIGELVGKATQFPFNALNWQDEFMFTAAYSGDVFRGAYRQAIKEGLHGAKAFGRVNQIVKEQAHKLGDLHGQAMREAQRQVTERAAKIAEGQAKNPLSLEQLTLSEWRKFVEQSVPDVNRAREAAEKTIFIAREGKRLDQAVDMLDEFDSKFYGVLSIPLPFRRTPANVMRETIRSSPAGLVAPIAELGAKGAQAATGEMMDRLGQAVAGTGMLYGIWSMMKMGLVEAEPYGREKGRADRLTKELAGVGQDSIRVGNWSIPVDRIEPIGTMVLAAARADELAKSGEVDAGMEELATVAWELTKQSANSTFLDGMAQFFAAAQGEERTSRKYAQRLGASFVPAAVRDVSRVLGAPMEEVPAGEGPTGPIPLAKEAIKGFAGALGIGEREKLGTFGKPRQPGLPFVGAREAGNPVAQELVNIGAPLDIPNLPAAIDAKTLASGERETFIKAKGQMQEYALQRLLVSPRYASLSNDAKKRLVKSAISKVNRRINARATALKKRGRKWTTRDLLRGFIQTGG